MAKKKKPTTSSNGALRPKRAAAKNAKKQVVEIQVREAKLVRHVSPTEKAIFANHIVVRADASTFEFFFFHAEAPLTVDEDPEAVKQAAAERSHVDAYCVSRIVIPDHVMPKLVRALSANLERQKDLAATLKAHFESQNEEGGGGK